MPRPSADLTVPETPSAQALDDRPAQLPQRYRLGEVIGSGGMGRVYRAHDLVLGREVAIKALDANLFGADGGTVRRERFVREARAAARLDHPNIVSVHDVDADAGWFVMDLVEGESLREVAARGRIPLGLVVRIAEQVLSALDAAHAAGVVHRDIKPSNIILDAHGKATLVDFGVARLVDAELTRTGESLGTPAYMAPEQIRGAPVDERTDLYGLGATLYELVTGDYIIAFESPSAATLAVVHEACASEPSLGHVIGRCLQGEPGARFGSAREALAALRAPPPAPRRARWLVPVIAGVVAATIAATIAYLVVGRGGARPTDEMFALAQRGEHEKAALLLDEHLRRHPDDGDAHAMKFLVDWWRTGNFDEAVVTAIDPELSPVQRAMVRGITLMATRQSAEAIAYLEAAQREHGASPEITYVLGEARWHGEFIERGVATLEEAFALDPTWQMALHHVIEYRLSRGEAARLRPLVGQLDAARAAALTCEIAIGERRYRDAAGGALAVLDTVERIPELYVCLAHAQVLSGDLDAAERTTRQAIERWPIDLREWGATATETELLLYRGKLEDTIEKLRGKSSRQRDLALLLWKPEAMTSPPVAPPLPPPDPAVPVRGMRPPPIGIAMDILMEHLRGRDAVASYDSDPQLELRAYGRGLAAVLRGDTTAAVSELRKALAVPSKGDIRMLVAHDLARVLHASGDAAGAAAACEDVISPRAYHGYRAILLPDCILWSNDRAKWQQLDAAWRGDFAHPAIVEIRRRLR